MANQEQKPKRVRTIGEEICLLLVEWDISLNPEDYPHSKKLTPNDFKDAALDWAKTLGIEKAFREMQKAFKDGAYTDKGYKKHK